MDYVNIWIRSNRKDNKENTVCPGFHLTERLRKLSMLTDQKEDVEIDVALSRIASVTAAKRIGDPKEFGALVAFLCSERAAYITGAAIQIDGELYKAIF